MQCTSPVWLKDKGLYVPCNHCISCRIAYAREWSVRLMNEYETSFGKGSFITLTYSDDNLPSDMSIHKDELQRFFKRLRKKLGKHKIKYYACGEYGEKGHRPHYHAIVFGLSVMDMSIVLPDCWKLGFYKIMPVYYESCKYVCQYVMKKYNGDVAKEVYGDKEIPFRLSSLGLGKDYALKYRDEILSQGGVRMSGINKGLPKYYKILYERDDMLDCAQYWTENNLDPEDFKVLKEKTKKELDWRKAIIDKAIESKAEEQKAFEDWYSEFKPDDIVENCVLTPFDVWSRQVNKLRDLTVKAKCSLHDSKRKL